MDRKKIQEQRKRRYFIDAAKNIIKDKGVQNLTVKKVADLAGFAPGTLYNYFNDLNSLLAYCAADFWEECKNYVLNVININEEISKLAVKEKIISSCKAYVNYFFDNPNVFKLIFLEEFDQIPVEIARKVYHPEIVSLLSSYLKNGVEEGLILKEDLETTENIIANFLHGILLFFIMERAVETREEMQQNIERNIKFLLSL